MSHIETNTTTAEPEPEPLLPSVEDADYWEFAVASSFITLRPGETLKGSRYRPFRKICAKVVSGVRFGLGCVLERSCGAECQRCTGKPSHRQCRFFDFRPHYEVVLERKSSEPHINVSSDVDWRDFHSRPV